MEKVELRSEDVALLHSQCLYDDRLRVLEHESHLDAASCAALVTIAALAVPLVSVAALAVQCSE